MPVQLNGQDLITSFSDVEEGVFTPAIADGTIGDGASECQTYLKQAGSYQKVGNRVYFQLRVSINSLGNLATCETVHIVGLPFTVQNTTNYEASVYVGLATSLAITAGESVNGFANVNTTYIIPRVWNATTGNSSMLISELTAGGDLMVSGHYEV